MELFGCFESEVLIFLTSLFPLVKNLLVYPSTLPNGQTDGTRCPNPSSSVKFQGEIVLTWLKAQHEDFLAFVNERSSDVHSINVYFCENNGELQKLFDRQGGKLSSVGFGTLDRGGKFTPVRHCVRLSL